jgi:translation initiation factor IF-2
LKLKSRKKPGETQAAEEPKEVKKVVEDKRKRKKKKSIREQIREEDVDKAIRETLAGISDHSAGSRAKMRQKRKAEREEKEQRIQEEIEKQSQILQLTEFVTTNDLANMINVPVSDIIKKCLQLGLMVTINQRLDKETIQLIAVDYGFEVEFLDDQAIQFIDDEEDEDEELQPRAPIVTIMGHVDHGKTSLLDNIRKANVVAGEAGGITQHIGAYQVKTAQGKYITFLDTPGHEAFTAMRARGAQVTDIVVLVVAADDSVMPQTVEAISHAKAAGVPIVVAINKVDKPDSNPDRIKQQLADYGILVEEWGGTNQSAEISAKFGKNIDVLLDKILLEAEILELKANPDRNARGIVIEANMDKGLGPVATIVVQKGTLMQGEPFVAGVSWGRVRNMLDERGNKIEQALPSMPVRVVGFDSLPTAGDSFMVVNSDSEAKNIANERNQLKRQQEMRHAHHMTLDEISQQIQMGGVRDLNLIIKGDVWGSVEAIGDSLQKLSRDEVRVNIIHKGVGAITENDVMLAIASKAVIIGFSVNPNTAAKKLADQESIDIRLYNIIYDAINEIRLALEGLLAPEIKENITATIEVRRVFKISRLGSIAGCYVSSGKVTRSDKIRVLRDGLPIFKGTISSLKRGKDDVREVDQGYECGIQLEGFNDLVEGDILETYQIVEVKRKFQ